MFWNIFKSVKLAVFLLIILAIVAILGTIIPQGEESIRFAMRLKPEVFRVISALGLFDVYHTLWFRFLLALLALNLIVCSIDRFPKTWKRIKASPAVDMKRPFENIDEDKIIRIKGETSSITKKVEGYLKRLNRQVKSKITTKESFFYFEEGIYSAFGVYIVHLSVIMVLIGGIIGSIWGFEGYMNILEGDKANVVRLSRKIRPLKLNFYVRCDKFLVDYYKNGMPKEYKSELTFIMGDKEIKKELRVNHPARFQGITFYQASYGISTGDKAFIKIINNKTGKHFNFWLSIGESHNIPDTGFVVRLLDIRKDFARSGPAIFLGVSTEKGKEMRLILLKDINKAKKRIPPAMLNAPVFNPSAIEPYTFVLKDIPTKYYTGLQVSKDPGVPFVWTGFVMLILGLMITFFTSHKRIWVRLTKRNGDSVEIAVAGMSNRDKVSLSKRLSHILNGINKEVGINV